MSQENTPNCGCCQQPQTVKLPIRNIGFPMHGVSIDVDMDAIKPCRCERARPDKQGLVPDGGKAGELYGVSPNGGEYVFADPKEFRLRKLCQSDVTLHIRTDGNDANDGLSDSPDGAFASFDGVNKFIDEYDLGGHRLNVIFGSGIFTDVPVYLELSKCVGILQIRIAGQSDMSTVLANTGADKPNAVYIRGAGPYVYLENLNIEKSGAYNAIRVEFKATVLLTGRIHLHGAASALNGSCPDAITAANFGQVDSYAELNISGRWQFVFVSSDSGSLSFGKVNYNDAACVCNAKCSILSGINLYGTEFTGGGSGIRYQVAWNAVISTNGKPATFIPGSQDGEAKTGGIYA